MDLPTLEGIVQHALTQIVENLSLTGIVASWSLYAHTFIIYFEAIMGPKNWESRLEIFSIYLQKNVYFPSQAACIS